MNATIVRGSVCIPMTFMDHILIVVINLQVLIMVYQRQDDNYPFLLTLHLIILAKVRHVYCRLFTTQESLSACDNSKRHHHFKLYFFFCSFKLYIKRSVTASYKGVYTI